MDRSPQSQEIEEDKSVPSSNESARHSSPSVNARGRGGHQSTFHRRPSGGPPGGGGAYGRHPQHHMQFKSTHYGNHDSQGAYPVDNHRGPRHGHSRSNRPQFNAHVGQPPPPPQPLSGYDMWNGYNTPDPYGDNITRSPSSPSFDGSSNSTTHVSPSRGKRVTINPRIMGEDFKSKLKGLCEKNSLPTPQYATMAAKATKHRSSDFCSTLTIGDEKWRTSPKFYPSKEEAEQFAAKKAYKELFDRHRSTATPEECAEMDKDLLVDRVKKILRNKGPYFSGAVEDEFKKKYRKELPSNWIEIFTSACDDVKVDVTQVTNKTLTTLTYSELSIGQFHLSEEDAKEEWLFVRVVTANSPRSFWLHLMQDGALLPEKFRQFSAKLGEYYDSPQSTVIPVDKVTKGKLAVIRIKDGGARFQVKQVIKSSTSVDRTSPQVSNDNEDVGKNSGEHNSEEKGEEKIEETSEEKSEQEKQDETSCRDKENEDAAKDSSADVVDDPSETKEEEKSTNSNGKSVCESANDTRPAETPDVPRNSATNEPYVAGYAIDFGQRLNVPITSLKSLDEQFTQLPRQAVECSLAVEPINDHWTDEARKFFSSRVINQVLFMKILDKDRMVIDLVDTRTEPSSNIGDELINQKFAKKPPSPETQDGTSGQESTGHQQQQQEQQPQQQQEQEQQQQTATSA